MKRRWFNFILKPKPFQVRLYAIDAPEISQPHGVEAREKMREMARGTFRVDVMSTDRYGRAVGVVYRRKKSGSLNRRMVSAGLAYAYERYGKLDGIAKAESQARKRRRGVWKSGKSQTRPWTHRRRLRKTGRKGKGWLRSLMRFAALFGLALTVLVTAQWWWTYVEEMIRTMLS